MDFELAVSSSFRELSSEEMKKEQRQTLEAIDLDLREVLLPLILIQKLLMEQVTALDRDDYKTKKHSNVLKLL